MTDPKPLTQREYWNGKVGDEWAAQADRTDRMLAPLNAAGFAVLRLQPGEHALDIGCGAGATTMEMAALVGAGGRVVGVDLSRPLLDLGRKRAADQGLAVTFAEADAGVEAIPGAPFDAAFSRFGVMFFSDPVAAFAHMRAAMRPGGRLVFVCWRPMKTNYWATIPIDAITPLLKAPLTPPDPEAPGPYALADDAKVRRILQQSGWRDVAIEPWDGDLVIGGSGGAQETADFMTRIGPCARAIADQDIDRAEAMQRIVDKLAPHQTPDGVALPAACWIVSARA